MGNYNCFFSKHERLHEDSDLKGLKGNFTPGTTITTEEEDSLLSRKSHVTSLSISTTNVDSDKGSHYESGLDGDSLCFSQNPSPSCGTESLMMSHDPFEWTDNTHHLPIRDISRKTMVVPRRLLFEGRQTQQHAIVPCNVVDLHHDSRKVSMPNRALYHRLEKARSVQLALLNPSSLARQATTPRHYHNDDLLGTLWAKTAIDVDAQIDFEDMSCTGIVWTETKRPQSVSALAMSSRASLGDSQETRMLMAIGTNDGTISVAQVLDDSLETLKGAQKLGSMSELRRSSRVRSLHFSPDGHYLVSGGDDCTAAVIKISMCDDPVIDATFDKSKQLLLELVREIERVDRVYTVQFSPDGSRLAIGCFDGSIIILEMTSITAEGSQSDVRTEIEIFREALVLSLDWSPNSSYLAIGGTDNVCAIYETSSWQLIREVRRSASVQNIKWSPNALRIAVGDRSVGILDANTFETLREVECYDDHSNVKLENQTLYRITALCWSPNGEFLAICGSEKHCVVVETDTYTLLQKLRRNERLTSVAWIQRQRKTGESIRYLALGGEDCTVAILKAGFDIVGSTSSFGESDISSSVCSSLHVANERTGQQDASGENEESGNTDVQEPPAYEDMEITSLSFSKGSKSKPSKLFACAFNNNSVVVRSTTDWTIIWRKVFLSTIRSVAFSTGSTMVMAGDGGIVYIVSTQTWSVLAEREMNCPIVKICFSKNNQILTVGNSDGLIVMLNSRKDWAVVGAIDSSESAVCCLDWSSRNFAVSREDGSLSIYDADKVYSSFYIPCADISRSCASRTITFGVSGRFLATGGADGSIGVYSAKAGWVLCHQIETASSISCVSWNPTGRYLGYIGENRDLRIVDTIFWADVSEAKKETSRILKDVEVNYLAGVTFSQDCDWFAIGASGGDIYVFETPSWRWALTLSHCAPNDQSSPSSSDAESNNSVSISSPSSAVDGISLSTSSCEGVKSITASPDRED